MKKTPFMLLNLFISTSKPTHDVVRIFPQLRWIDNFRGSDIAKAFPEFGK